MGPGTCGPKKKRRFSSERVANKALNKIWRDAIYGRRRSESIPCRVYRCPACHGWHFTSQPARK